MGEVDGDGIESRCEPTDVEAGVGSSEPELVEPEEDDETDMERDLPRAPLKGMEMGSE